jgi:hypothetical protein
MRNKLLSASLCLFSLLPACGGPLFASRNAIPTPGDKASSAATPSPIISSRNESAAEVPAQAQREFGAEAKIPHPVTVPDAVLRVLRSDDYNLKCLRVGEGPDDILASWFTAAEVHLSQSRAADFVVQAANPRLFGANIIPFWVFRGTPAGPQLALRVHTFNLNILESKTKDYRDIQSEAPAAGKILRNFYSFNGVEYKLRRSREIPIRAT